MIKLSLLNKNSLKAYLLIASMLLLNNTKAQNLIRNGSFENYNTPISWNLWGGDFIGYYSSPPDTVMIDWKEINSADCFMTACTHTYSGVPVNKFGQIYPKEGSNIAGLETVYNNSETKEYIYQRLSSPLQAGKIYCLSFFVSRADRISYAIKSIGAYFSNNVQSTGSIGYINAAPQVVNQSGFITDTTNWVQIQGCFTAQGGEQYITIGNFNSNANTDTLRIQPINPLSTSTVDIAYYYIDDITLIDQTTVGINEIQKQNNIEVYPNPAINLLQVDVLQPKDDFIIEIYNALGELVLQEPVISDHSEIHIEHLKNGIYYYTISANGQSIKNDKIIVIK